MRKKLIHHRSVRVRRIYDGSIRRPRTGADDNKSVGLNLTPAQTVELGLGILSYLGSALKRKLTGLETTPLTITAYKYNKGPKGHAATLTSPSK